MSAFCLRGKFRLLRFRRAENREEVLPSRNSSILRIRTSFLAGSPSLPTARKLVLILKLLLFLLGNTSCLAVAAVYHDLDLNIS